MSTCHVAGMNRELSEVTAEGLAAATGYDTAEECIASAVEAITCGHQPPLPAAATPVDHRCIVR